MNPPFSHRPPPAAATRRALLAAAAALVLMAPGAQAQPAAYPAKPVKLIVPSHPVAAPTPWRG
jgi:hypothetical protein